MHPTTLALIRAALAEDIGPGDVTSTYFLGANTHNKARIIAREPGIVSGMAAAETVFKEVDPGLRISVHHPDGTTFVAGDTLIEIEGRTRSLLTAERTALNFLQRLSGVATMTALYVEAVKPYPVEVWDTRKTTPGWRLLEKQAVKSGGGVNHRMGLYDAVMVKDNHLAADGSLSTLQTAINHVRRDHPDMRIQLEAATLEQLADFLSLQGVDLVLLDNMDLTQLRQAVTLNAGRLWLEASGGITLHTIHDVASTGVNSISSGALTHSVRALDLALDLF